MDRSPDAGGLRIRLNKVVSLGVAVFAALFVLVTAIVFPLNWILRRKELVS